MKVAIVVGARPQFIKLAPLYQAFLKKKVVPIVLHTGQHYDESMSQAFFIGLGLPPPNYQLQLNRAYRSVQRMDAIQQWAMAILAEEMPDCVIVFGDTDSTLAGALAAKQAGLELAHIEAGLRSGNANMPEEANRIATDGMSDWLFAPTSAEAAVLHREKVQASVVVSGDIMLDAYLHYRHLARPPSFGVEAPFCLATLHRNFNTDEPGRLTDIIAQLNFIHASYCPIVLPAHPRLKRALGQIGIEPAFYLCTPVPYLELLWLLARAEAVITDSGGLQKEAYFAGKRCLVPRSETEWAVLAERGYSVLAEPSELALRFQLMQSQPTAFAEGLLGNGQASSLIVKTLMER